MEGLVTTIMKILEKVGTLLKFIFHLNAPYFRTDLAKDEYQRKLFECPGCSDIPLPPIFTCSSGHIVCGSCKEQLESCPQCQGDYKGQARNFVVETIINTRDFNCRYSDEGCTKVLRGLDLIQHQNECHFRHVQCNIIDTALCDGTWKGSVLNYYSHLVMTHDMELVFRNKFVTFKAQIDPKTKEFIAFLQPTVVLKVVQGNNFIIQQFYDETSKNIFIFTTSIYKQQVDDESFKTSLVPAQTIIKLFHNNCHFNEIDWRGSVNSVYDSIDNILKKQDGLIISYNNFIQLANLSNSNSMATWNFQVEFDLPKINSNKISQSSSFLTHLITMKDLFQTFFGPLFKSGWSLIAPIFTILFILFFVLFV